MRTEDWGRPDSGGEQGDDEGLLGAMVAATIIAMWSLAVRVVRFLGFHD